MNRDKLIQLICSPSTNSLQMAILLSDKPTVRELIHEIVVDKKYFEYTIESLTDQNGNYKQHVWILDTEHFRIAYESKEEKQGHLIQDYFGINTMGFGSCGVCYNKKDVEHMINIIFKRQKF